MTHHCWRHCFFHYSSLKKTASEVTDVDTQAVIRLATKQVRSSIFFFWGIEDFLYLKISTFAFFSIWKSPFLRFSAWKSPNFFLKFLILFLDHSKHVWDLFWNMNLLRVQVVRGSKFQSSVKHYTWSSHYCCCRGGYIVWFMILHDYDLMRPSRSSHIAASNSSCIYFLDIGLKKPCRNILLFLYYYHFL